MDSIPKTAAPRGQIAADLEGLVRSERESEIVAVDDLARSLHRKMWHLEPSSTDPEIEWNAMDDGEREFYRLLVLHLIGKLGAYGLRRPLTTTYGADPYRE